MEAFRGAHNFTSRPSITDEGRWCPLGRGRRKHPWTKEEVLLTGLLTVLLTGLLTGLLTVLLTGLLTGLLTSLLTGLLTGLRPKE
ncbi:hypothetical protein NHX12_006808 [Muraenolepis orangiensis]|uniref:Uncharacterized protein n=1 Tax=Muraenolepis orangiensis TaxID=630683 RepID=A0A9Q0DQ51_9TELE|nr:hypothetical protein NHX12_006808 [Muraenolepis orangiensis]